MSVLSLSAVVAKLVRLTSARGDGRHASSLSVSLCVPGRGAQDGQDKALPLARVTELTKDCVDAAPRMPTSSLGPPWAPRMKGGHSARETRRPLAPFSPEQQLLRRVLVKVCVPGAGGFSRRCSRTETCDWVPVNLSKR